MLAALVALACCAGAAAQRPSGTVWLCRPGLAGDPCTQSLTATAVRADGSRQVEHASPARDPRIDCFYVYPTVSTQPTTNANLHVDPQERAVAIAQASRFSQVCRVWAPMYPQLTLSAIANPRAITLEAELKAYDGVLAAFRDYLAHWNHGRGIVFIGHSQGAFALIHLLAQEVDPSPSLRKRLVSAIMLGGNVTVARGRTTGGSFTHIPACASRSQTGCVVAYSSFAGQPPADSRFGRVASSRLQVLCVNPAAPGGGAGALQPFFPAALVGLSGVKTPWITFPGEYTARCRSAGGATWLQVDRVARPGDDRPAVHESLGPAWGLHEVDVNIALGNLVALVRAEAAAHRR